MDAETLSSKERHTLRVLADTLVPSLAVSPDSDGFYGRKASDLAVDEDVARIIERYLSPEQRADFRRLLRTVESPMANLLLSGTPRRFSTESEANRERFLLGWAHSRLGIKRQGFHAVKRLVLFLTYAKVLDGGVNPNWPSIGYAGPPSAESPLPRHPSEVRIEPLKPTGETALDADVCVVGSGAGGFGVAPPPARAGYPGIVLEAGADHPAGPLPDRGGRGGGPDVYTHRPAPTGDPGLSVSP